MKNSAFVEKDCLKYFEIFSGNTFETKYSRMDQVKFVEDSF